MVNASPWAVRAKLGRVNLPMLQHVFPSDPSVSFCHMCVSQYSSGALPPQVIFMSLRCLQFDSGLGPINLDFHYENII